MNEVGNRIKIIRTESQNKKMSMAAFAQKIGVTSGAVSQWESGDRSPTDSKIKLICKEFGINETWLLTGEGDMNQPMSEEQEIAQITASLFNEDDQRRINLFKFIASLDEEDMEALERLWVKAEDFFKKGE